MVKHFSNSLDNSFNNILYNIICWFTNFPHGNPKRSDGRWDRLSFPLASSRSATRKSHGRGRVGRLPLGKRGSRRFSRAPIPLDAALGAPGSGEHSAATLDASGSGEHSAATLDAPGSGEHSAATLDASGFGQHGKDAAWAVSLAVSVRSNQNIVNRAQGRADVRVRGLPALRRPTRCGCALGADRRGHEASRQSPAAIKIHEGGMSHAAMPAPVSMPNAKTATAAITRAGVRVIKVLSFVQGCSAMGTGQRSPASTQSEARFMPPAISHEDRFTDRLGP